MIEPPTIEIELDLARTCFGQLTDTQRVWLLTFYYFPSDDSWDECCNLTIQPYGLLNTVWQAVCAIDPTFPTRGPSEDTYGNRVELWPRIPTPEQFRNALMFATR